MLIYAAKFSSALFELVFLVGMAGLVSPSIFGRVAKADILRFKGVEGYL
jgi:hypothetical protein